MVEKENHTIRNGAIASVLGGLILAVILSFREAFLKALNSVLQGIFWLWHGITASYLVSGWWLWTIVGFGILGFIKLLHAIWPGENPEHLNYCEDYMYGAKWRWQWISNSISNLWAYCPNCDCELVYDDSSCRRFSEPHKTDFICERCRNSVVATVSGGDKNYAISAIQREIRRRIRTNEYKNCMGRPPAQA